MKELGRTKSAAACFGMITIFLLLISGCAVSKTKNAGSPSSSIPQKENKNAPVYHDFEDVLIPAKLKAVRDSSFVFQTPGFSAGVLTLKGKIDINSLFAFFDTNMAKDNWSVIATFKLPRSIMMYKKENRWCVISINKKERNTLVEIWVAPTISGAESGLLK